jgi:hypothetical protein
LRCATLNYGPKETSRGLDDGQLSGRWRHQLLNIRGERNQGLANVRCEVVVQVQQFNACPESMPKYALRDNAINTKGGLG